LSKIVSNLFKYKSDAGPSIITISIGTVISVSGGYQGVIITHYGRTPVMSNVAEAERGAQRIVREAGIRYRHDGQLGGCGDR